MLGLIFNRGSLDHLFTSTVSKMGESRGVNNIMRLVSEGMRPNLPDPEDKEKCPECIRELIQQCWLQDPAKRPSASELAKIVTHIVPPQLLPERINNPEKYDANAAFAEAKEVRAAVRRRSQVVLTGLNPNPAVLKAMAEKKEENKEEEEKKIVKKEEDKTQEEKEEEMIEKLYQEKKAKEEKKKKLWQIH